MQLNVSIPMEIYWVIYFEYHWHSHCHILNQFYVLSFTLLVLEI